MKMKFHHNHNGDLNSYKIEDQNLSKNVAGIRRYVACCDCGLVHEYLIFVENTKIKIVAWRDKRGTKQYRKSHKTEFIKRK